MLRPILLVAGWIAKGHDRWRSRVAKLRPLRVQVDVLEERNRRLTVENSLLRNRMARVAPRHRPHYRRHERLDILWHAERYRLSVEKLARLFVVSVGTILNWRRAVRTEPTRLVEPQHPANRLPDFVGDLTRRIRREWPGWGTRRIAGILLRLGVHVSRQAFLRRPVRRPKEEQKGRARVGHVVARYPGHLWFIRSIRESDPWRCARP